MRNFYIDDTDVDSDNLDKHCTVLRYKDEPKKSFTVDTRFALWVAYNALENAYKKLPHSVEKAYAILLKHLNK